MVFHLDKELGSELGPPFGDRLGPALGSRLEKELGRIHDEMLHLKLNLELEAALWMVLVK